MHIIVYIDEKVETMDKSFRVATIDQGRLSMVHRMISMS